MAKLNQSIRMALEIFVKENVDNFQDWYRQVDDPKWKCELYIKMCKYFIPVLMHVSGNMNVKHSVADYSDEELELLVKNGIRESPKLITDGSGSERRDN